MSPRGGKGAALYSTLSDLQFPHLSKFSPDALDWLYEDVDIKKLLDWITANVSAQNYLSQDELDAYHQIPKSELLSGDVLEAALEAAADQDSDLSNEELERKIAKLETEIGWHEESADTMSMVKRRLVEKNNSDTIELGRLRSEAEKQSLEERRIQEQVLQVNSQYNSALLSLRTSLEQLVSEYTNPPVRSKDVDARVHLSHLQLQRIQEKEEELDSELGKLLNALFGSKFSELGIGGNVDVEDDGSVGLIDPNSDSVLELLRGRDKTEFLQLRSEINRVRAGIFRAEMDRIETAAKPSTSTSNLWR